MLDRSTSVALTLLMTLVGCDSERAEDTLRAGPAQGQHPHPGKNHYKSPCERLDIRELLEDYDEASNPYSNPEMWLSGPDAIDDFVMDVNLDTTIVHSDLSTEVIHPVRPQDPDLDIFFLHPTVNLSPVLGNDDLTDLTNTKLFVAESVARFSTIGRVIAPLYHSATAGAFFPESHDVRDEYFEVAYQDVEAAFTYYLANHWNGRKLVIMGLSQGGIMTRMLLQRLVAGHPDLMSRVVAVVPLSADIQVDSFDFLSPCEVADETGCYITYNAYLEGDGPSNEPPTTFGEWVGTPTTACTNVAGAAGEAGTFSMSYFSLPLVPGLLPADALTDIPIAIDTPFMAFPGYYAAECVDKDGKYLEVRQADVDDQRWTPIDYSHPFLSTAPPFGLGLHLFDFGLGMGDLLELVDEKADQLDDESAFCVKQ